MLVVLFYDLAWKALKSVELQVNCVVTRGVNEDEMVSFVEWTRNKVGEGYLLLSKTFGPVGCSFGALSDA